MFRGPSDWTPVHRAVWSHNATEVKSLVRRGGDLNAKDKQGWTPLHLACAAESGMLFYSHQLSPRDYSRYSVGPGSRKYISREWGPTRRSDEAEEIVASMAILEILLANGADVHKRAQGFCTPLHCAADSGWLSHAIALVKAGARVYTGPECSPLCWVRDGNGGSHPVARFLRLELGDRGLSMIEQDHERDGTPAKKVLPRDDEPLFKTQTSQLIGSNGLCSVCSEMTLESFLLPGGFKHLSSFDNVRQSAECCKFCNIIVSTLTERGLRSSEAEGQVLISTPRKNNNPIDNLQIKLSAGCLCDGSIPYASPDFSKCRGNCAVRMSAEIVVFTKQDMSGCAIPIQKGNDNGPVAELGDALDFMKRCLVRCDLYHPGCKSHHVLNDASPSSGHKSSLPSRLIEVSKDDRMEIRLVDTIEKSGRYAAFSHRWASGPMPQWATVKDTIGQRRSWFPAAEYLPASLVDAITITRRLGLDYVWIDSICIIQDSPEDWNNEAAAMASVYANAYVTLFADVAKDDDHGFLIPRQVFPSTSIEIQRENDTRVTVQVRKSSPYSWRYPRGVSFDFDTRMFSHLTGRAWILQERLLSRRKLHFGAHQVHWVCSEYVLNEDGDLPSKGGYLKMESDIYTMMKSPKITDRAFQRTWRQLVESYSSLELSHIEDKLPALSGLAQVFYKLSRDDYIAGIWKQSFATELAWSVAILDPDKMSPRPAKYRAPSFSWACVDDRVEMKHSEYYTTEPIPHDVDISLVSTDIDLEGRDPFGKIRSGKIVVSGLFRKAITLGPFPTALGDLRKGWHPLYDVDMCPIGCMLNDAKGDMQDGELEVMCLKLFSLGDSATFLVLLPTDPRDEGCATFRRVGLGTTGLTHGNSYGDEKFFDAAERRTVTIV